MDVLFSTGCDCPRLGCDSPLANAPSSGDHPVLSPCRALRRLAIICLRTATIIVLDVLLSWRQNVRGMTLIVYLDEFNTQLVKEFNASPRHSMATGVRLAVHGQGTAPDMTSAISAGPGTETTVSVSPTQRQRLQQPYHGCRPSNQPPTDGSSDTYTAEECTDICLQKQVWPRSSSS